MRPIGGILLGGLHRSQRPKGRFAIDPRPDDRSNRHDGVCAYLRCNRRCGTRDHRARSTVAGLCHGGRVGERCRLSRRKRPGSPARLLRVLDVGGRRPGHAHGGSAERVRDASLPPDALDSWGWRVPFLFGLIIGPVGLYIRHHVDETQVFLEARAAAKENEGLGRMIATHLKEIVVGLGLFSHGTASTYVILLYMPTYASTQLHLPLGEAFISQSIGLACMIFLVPLFGALSDRIGRKPIFIGALVLY